jgi:pilus assembly protein CpaE
MAKILVLDDEADLLEMMRLVLEQRAGHQVVLSAEAPEGLARALADPPDLAILDVMMPDMTGYEVCRQLRANPATAAIPIIILTARAQPMDRDAALSAGADTYMTKPVMMNELLEKVEALLTRRSEGGPALSGPVTLMSLRGGVGVTTLAVNLAATLLQTDAASVCLVDLCPTSGHVALQLGLRPEPSWLDIARAAESRPVNADLVAAHLLTHSSGLQVVAAPFLPLVETELTQSVLEALLTTLQRQFAVVVVDAPPVLNETAMTVLEMSAVVGLVVTPEPAAIQTTIGTLRALLQWTDKYRVILNQVTPGPLPPTEAIERALKRPVVAVVPFDTDQARAVAQRTPLAIGKPQTPLAQAISGIAQALGR